MKIRKNSLRMLLAAVIILAVSMTVFAATVTVTVPEGNEHTFAAYQIFTGTQEASEGGLAEVEWGSGIKAVDFLAALKADTSGAFAYTDTNGTESNEDDVSYENVFNQDTVSTAADVADKLSLFADKSAAAEQFAKLALANTNGTPATLDSENGTELASGYYLIVDTTDVEGEDDVANPALLQLTNDIEINAKTAKPTVDKQVWDEEADAEEGHSNGWGETADHAINETFQFKLIANLPDTIGFDRYETYEVKFTDTWSEGVTFEDILSITVDDVVVYEKDGTNNIEEVHTVSVDATTRTMTIDFSDIKTISDDIDLSNGAVIEVIYNAHLNESAIVNNSSFEGTKLADHNNNGVYLEYSNNPDATGEGKTLGKTPEDYVFVFTYKVENTKYKNSVDDANRLSGAGFRLYKSDGETEIALIYDEDLSAYRPIKGQETGVEMVSAETTGKFDIVGLDAGTYVLKETSTPSGYNPCDPITIEISAEHKENENEVSAYLDLSGSKSMTNNVINNSGKVLPETGGAGTKAIYIVGGIMMVGAAVLLVAKKKMSAAED